MNFIISIIRTLFRHRWLILIGTALFTLMVIYYTRHMRGGYDVKATLYTGVASGYNLESDKRTDWATVQNSMDNLISIMQAESTLKEYACGYLPVSSSKEVQIKKITVLQLPATTTPTII